MDLKTQILLGITMILTVGSLSLSLNSAEGSTLSNLTDALTVFTQGQASLIFQNDVLISQNYEIIDLLKGDTNIFVAGETDRYKLLEWKGVNKCTYYDKLLQVESTGGYSTCPVMGLTKSEFKDLVIEGIPQK